MPNYSVIITMQGNTRREIRNRLQTALGSTIAQDAQIMEPGVLLSCHEACRVNDHFGCVHWTDEDLRTKLRELKVPITTEMLDSMRASYALQHIDDRMIELGWEVITQAIFDTGVVERIP